MRGAVLGVVGILLAGFGLVAMMLGGYIGYGESGSKAAEGIPFIAVGAALALAGLSAAVVAIIRTLKARRG
jgi:hypothetical protein